MGIARNGNRFDFLDYFNLILRICIQNLTMINHFSFDKYLIFHQNSLKFLFFPNINLHKFFIKKTKERALKFSFIFI